MWWSRWPLRMRTRRVAVGGGVAAGVVVVVIVLVARGGGATSGAARHPAEFWVPGHPDYELGPPPTDSSASPTAPATSPAGGVAAQGHTAPPPSPAASFTVTLAASCVIPGGTQTLTAQSRPGYTVAYNSHYADGKTGDTYGGYGLLTTDARGRAVATWTVATSAPLGQVTIGVGTANGGAPTTATRTFVVAAHC